MKGEKQLNLVSMKITKPYYNFYVCKGILVFSTKAELISLVSNKP